MIASQTGWSEVDIMNTPLDRLNLFLVAFQRINGEGSSYNVSLFAQDRLLNALDEYSIILNKENEHGES